MKIKKYILGIALIGWMGSSFPIHGMTIMLRVIV